MDIKCMRTQTAPLDFSLAEDREIEVKYLFQGYTQCDGLARSQPTTLGSYPTRYHLATLSLTLYSKAQL